VPAVATPPVPALAADEVESIVAPPALVPIGKPVVLLAPPVAPAPVFPPPPVLAGSCVVAPPQAAPVASAPAASQLAKAVCRGIVLGSYFYSRAIVMPCDSPVLSLLNR
jgi:hypothetical protein